MEIICDGSCSFRVHDRYFADKERFSPTGCPTCNGPLKVVNDHSNTKATGASIDIDPSSATYRRVVTA